MTWLLCGAFGYPLYPAGPIGAAVYFGVLWKEYRIYQSKHPEFCCPWDVHLPQVSRMRNAFLPPIILFCIVLWLLPNFRPSREPTPPIWYKEESPKTVPKR